MTIQAKAHFYFAADDYAWSIYSDAYKSDCGFRPRGHSPENAYRYMQERHKEAMRHEQLRAEFPKRTLVNICGVLGRVIGYESDNPDAPYYGREGLRVRTLATGAVIEVDPIQCRRVN